MQRTWIEGERVRVRVGERVRAEAGVIEGRETWGCVVGELRDESCSHDNRRTVPHGRAGLHQESRRYGCPPNMTACTTSERA